MRSLLAIAVLMSTSLPAFAVLQVPEPETLSLVGIAVLGLFLTRHFKNKK